MAVRELIRNIFLVLWLIQLSHVASNLNSQKPKCKTEFCGSMPISYPFGISKNCYYDKSFEIECKKIYQTNQYDVVNPQYNPYLKIVDLEVKYISENNLQVLVPVNLSRCKDAISNYDLRVTPFSFSRTNIFVGLGCNIIAYTTDHNDDVIAWCACSDCDSHSYSNTCVGQLKQRIQTLRPMVQSTINRTIISNSSIDQKDVCGVGFLADQSWLSNQLYYSQQSQLYYSQQFYDYGYINEYQLAGISFNSEESVPVNLEWELDNMTAASLKVNDATTLCTSKPIWFQVNNTFYSNSTLQCSCRNGYDGDSYRPDGCQEQPYSSSGYYHERKKFNWKLLVIGVCSAIGGLIGVVLIWRLYQVVLKEIIKRKKAKYFKRNGGLLLQQQISSNDGSIEKTKVFSSNELEKATDNYNVDRVLGQGGQGTVYKGMLSDGKIIAVKKSTIMDTIGGGFKGGWGVAMALRVHGIFEKYLYKIRIFFNYSTTWLNRGNPAPPTQKSFQFRNPPLDTTKVQEFINEVVILSQINHRNVVKLLGCCLETEVPLLVYEFISNGTLFQHIHDPNEDFPLTWEMRLRIAVEIAGALSYMHSAASMPIYHRDIKSTNILLDEKYKARVSDFGTSRSVDVDITHFTTRVQGTFGYLDPEYFQTSQFTEKSDVYSFGVVLVELLTGKKPIFPNTSQGFRGLAPHFLEMMERNQFLEMIDPQISNEGMIEQMTAVAHLAKKCLNLKGKKRPTMKEVAAQLEGIKMSRESDAAQCYSGIIENNSIDYAMAYDTSSTTTETWGETSTASSTEIFPLYASP